MLATTPDPLEPPASETEVAKDFIPKPSSGHALDWVTDRPSPKEEIPASRPSIVFAPDINRSAEGDDPLLHTPFVVRRSRGRATPLLLIGGSILAFVLLNGVILLYLPNLLGEPSKKPELKGFISEPNIVAANAPAISAPTAAASTAPTAAPALRPMVQAKPAPAAAEAPHPVAVAKAPTPNVVRESEEARSAKALTAASGVITAPSAASAKIEPKTSSPKALAVAQPPAKPAPAIKAPVAEPKPVDVAASTPASSASEAIGSPPTAADGVLVQIGAFATPEVADHGWKAVATALPSEMVGKTRRVQPIPKDGSTLYRTMVGGFSNRVKAMEFCSALKEKGLACFVRP